MEKLGVNRDNQKKTNRGLVLKLIATKQCSSRADLARTMGLTKTALTQIVSELITKGYLVEVENAPSETAGEVGRTPIALGISPYAPRFAGLLISRTSCQAVLCDMELNILKRESVYREWMDRETLMENALELMDHMLKGEPHVAAIGAASIGPVDVKEGRINHPLYFHGIGDIEIRKILEERYQLPVYFDHDNQSAVLAEHLFGNGRGYKDILLVSVADGVGCGILVNGRRIHAAVGSAPEIGHVCVETKGWKCICGNRGCLESYINTRTMTERMRAVSGLDLNYEEFLLRDDLSDIDLLMREALTRLESAVISTLNILNSQIVLLGLDCCFWPDRYIEELEREVNRRKFNKCGMDIPVRKCCFLKDAQVLGACCNAINAAFHGELM